MNELKTLIGSIPEAATIAIILILILNAMMWFFLPFAIYGIKRRLDVLIDSLKFRI